MQASLPMYDLPGLEQATDAWWSALARAFRTAGLEDVPETLTRGGDMQAQWLSPDLLLSQTCGYPLTHALRGRVTLVATPSYACPGCAGGRYHSEILVREEAGYGDLADLRGARAVANGPGSQSGYSALRAAIAPLAEGGKFFDSLHFSGGHLNSMAEVAAGKADVCAVDCVTYHLLAREQPDAVAGLRRLEVSPSAPALPYITRRDIPATQLARLREGLRQAVADPALQDLRKRLLLDDILEKPLSAYDLIDEMEAEAAALGYPDLA